MTGINDERERKPMNCKSAASWTLVSVPLLYMGAYYATLTMDARGGCFAMPTYKIGEHRLPECSDAFFVE
jgi:hypothetical protein